MSIRSVEDALRQVTAATILPQISEAVLLPTWQPILFAGDTGDADLGRLRTAFMAQALNLDGEWDLRAASLIGVIHTLPGGDLDDLPELSQLASVSPDDAPEFLTVAARVLGLVQSHCWPYSPAIDQALAALADHGPTPRSRCVAGHERGMGLLRTVFDTPDPTPAAQTLALAVDSFAAAALRHPLPALWHDMTVFLQRLQQDRAPVEFRRTARERNLPGASLTEGALLSLWGNGPQGDEATVWDAALRFPGAMRADLDPMKYRTSWIDAAVAAELRLYDNWRRSRSRYVYGPGRTRATLAAPALRGVRLGEMAYALDGLQRLEAGRIGRIPTDIAEDLAFNTRIRLAGACLRMSPDDVCRHNLLDRSAPHAESVGPTPV